MTHPGGFPGDPAGQQPDGQPYREPGAFEYPPADYGTTPPPPYPAYDAPYPVPYGSPYGNPYPPTYANQPATNGMAIGSLVSSLVGIPAYFMCLPFVGSIIGVILGIVALSQISSRHQKGREMAIAGIAIGGGCLIGALILLLLYSSVFFWY
jgi:hypothetical protein